MSDDFDDFIRSRVGAGDHHSGGAYAALESLKPAMRRARLRRRAAIGSMSMAGVVAGGLGLVAFASLLRPPTTEQPAVSMNGTLPGVEQDHTVDAEPEPGRPTDTDTDTGTDTDSVDDLSDATTDADGDLVSEDFTPVTSDRPGVGTPVSPTPLVPVPPASADADDQPTGGATVGVPATGQPPAPAPASTPPSSTPGADPTPTTTPPTTIAPSPTPPPPGPSTPPTSTVIAPTPATTTAPSTETSTTAPPVTVTPPTTTPTAPTTAAPYGDRTLTTSCGSITVSYDSTSVSLISTSPSPGFSVDVKSSSPNVEVGFADARSECEISARVQGGQLVVTNHDSDD